MIVGDRTQQATSPAFEWASVGYVRAKGKTATVAAFRLVRELPSPRLRAPLAGRSADQSAQPVSEHDDEVMFYAHDNRPELHLSPILRPNGPALTFQVPNLKPNLMGSTVCEPTSELCRPPPSRHFYASAQAAPARGRYSFEG